MSGAVYIPTLARHELLKKTVPRWIEQRIPIRLVVRSDQFRSHVVLRDRMGWDGVTVINLPRGTFGFGAIRNFIIWHADVKRHRSIIICDDDLRPAAGSDFRLLLAEAARKGVLGVGAVRSIHDRFTGGAISRLSGPILCPGGWGFQCFAINVRQAIKLGNFDPELHTHGDDAELAREGIAHGIPWRVHCDVWTEAVAVRYAPGGIAALYPSREARGEAERENMALIHSRWPAYTNHPDKRVRTAWQKMLDDYIPDWRERSALHGGSL